MHTSDGLRAVSKGKPIASDALERYLASKFGEALKDTRAAMTSLAKALPPGELARAAYSLYEDFRPGIPAGTQGWGAEARQLLDSRRHDAFLVPRQGLRRAGGPSRPEAYS